MTLQIRENLVVGYLSRGMTRMHASVHEEMGLGCLEKYAVQSGRTSNTTQAYISCVGNILDDNDEGMNPIESLPSLHRIYLDKRVPYLL